MTDHPLLLIGGALLLCAAVLWLARAVDAVAAPAPVDERRAGARRRVRLLTGWVAAAALGVTALLAATVSTGSTAAETSDVTGTATTVDEAPASDPLAAIEEALPSLDEREPLADGGDGSDGFAQPQELPSRGHQGGGGFGSGGS